MDDDSRGYRTVLGCMELNLRKYNRDMCDDLLSLKNKNGRHKNLQLKEHMSWLRADLISRKQGLICTIISLGKTRRGTNWPWVSSVCLLLFTRGIL